MKDQLEFLDIMKIFFAHRWKILISAIVSAVILFLISAYMLTPTYTSRGSLYVNNSIKETDDVSLANLATSQQMALTCVDIFSSATFCQKIVDEANIPGLTPGGVKSMINISVQNETQILAISAVSYSPEDSETLVNAVLNNAQGEVDRVIKGGEVSVVDYASFSPIPSSPNVSQNAILGFFIGAILCMCVIFMVTYFDNRVKDETILLKVRELPLLGSVPNIDVIGLEEK